MKTRVSSLLAVLLAVGLTLGCGGDPPKADLDAASQALQAARDAGAEKYVGGELASAQRTFDDAKTAYDAEAEKWFKNWDKVVKPGLADATNKANAAAASATEAKNAARSAAEAAIAEAAAAVEETRANLDAAPAGKGTEVDMEQLRTDLGGADSDLAAARAAVDGEEFEEATAKANSAMSTAEAVAGGVEQAVARYHDLVEKNTPWYLKM